MNSSCLAFKHFKNLFIAWSRTRNQDNCFRPLLLWCIGNGLFRQEQDCNLMILSHWQMRKAQRMAVYLSDPHSTSASATVWRRTNCNPWTFDRIRKIISSQVSCLCSSHSPFHNDSAFCFTYLFRVDENALCLPHHVYSCRHSPYNFTKFEMLQWGSQLL